jgi:hypothetical protein
MDAPLLTDDFKEFLRLLNASRVEYLLVGGYAVGLHGYPRSTADLDIWIQTTPDNAARLVAAVDAFGFNLPELQPALFLDPRRIVRFGVPPFRIEIMTSIDGVQFDACRSRAVNFDLGGVIVPVISLADLKVNKRAAGRYKDLADLENLP